MRMNECYKEENIHVYVNPDDLRQWADAMEKQMETCHAGQLVWSYPIFSNDGKLRVTLTADQSWFHERDYWRKRNEQR